MSLTDPLATIVSILSNASTGLNSTGYEIYEDDGSTEASILVTYPMAKEKLNSLFGSTTDYDVIITVEAGEGDTEFIGLSTQVHNLPVKITAHTIEKHTTTGTGQKIITSELVIWKCFDVISRFIDAHVSAPGGSILTMEQKDHKFERDITIRPILYKCIIEVECKVIR